VNDEMKNAQFANNELMMRMIKTSFVASLFFLTFLPFHFTHCLQIANCSLHISDALASVVPSVTLRTNPNLATGLVGHWTFDGKDMVSNVADVSGNYATGSLVVGSSGIYTSTTTIPGRLGQAYSFDGVDDYVRLFSPPALNITGEMSMFAWVKRNVSQSSPYGSQRSSGNSPGQYALLSVTSGNKFTGGWGSYALTSNAALSNGMWYFIGFTRTGSAGNWTATTYYNGEVDKVGTTATDPGTQRGFSIGSNGDRLDSFLNGSVDDLRIYNRALSTSTIQRLYALGGTTHPATTIKTNPNLTTGLVGHWTFDGKDMVSNIADVSGNYATGSLLFSSGGFTATTTATGRLGQAYNFDGVDDAIKVSATTPINSLSAMTLTAWVYTRSIPSSYGTIFDKSQNSTVGWYFKNLVTSSRLSFNQSCTSGNGDVQLISGNNAFKLNRWQFFVATSDGSGSGTGAHLYIDGVETSYTTRTSCSPTPTISDDSSKALTFGNRIVGGAQPHNGLIDDLRIYNTVLSTSTLQRIQNLGGTTHPATTIKSSATLNEPGGLVAHHTFDGKDMVNRIIDATGRGNDGSLILGSTGITATTTLAGRIGQALKFDGVNDYIVLPPISSSWNFGKNITVSAWMRSTKDSGLMIYHQSTGSGLIHLSVGPTTSGGTNNKLVAYFRDDGGNLVKPSGNTTINDGKWHHVVAVLTTLSDASLYVDGVFDGSAAFIGSFDVSTSGAGSGHALGSLGGSSYFFQGDLDDARVYNRAFSAYEIKRVYDLGR